MTRTVPPNISFSKTSWRRLQRTTFRLSRPLEDVLQLRLQDVLEDKKMLHWRRLQYVFTKTNVCWVWSAIQTTGFYMKWNIGFKRVEKSTYWWNLTERILGNSILYPSFLFYFRPSTTWFVLYLHGVNNYLTDLNKCFIISVK